MVLRRFKKLEDTEAFAAYAKRQTAIRRRLSTSFMANWAHVGKILTQGFGVTDETADEIEMSTIEAPPCEHPQDKEEQDEANADD